MYNESDYYGESNARDERERREEMERREDERDELLAREREIELAWVDPADLMQEIANGWAATARRVA